LIRSRLWPSAAQLPYPFKETEYDRSQKAFARVGFTNPILIDERSTILLVTDVGSCKGVADLKADFPALCLSKMTASQKRAYLDR